MTARDLNSDLIKSDDLLTILDSINNNVQLSVESDDKKLLFLDILIKNRENWDGHLFKANRVNTLCFLPL